MSLEPSDIRAFTSAVSKFEEAVVKMAGSYGTKKGSTGGKPAGTAQTSHERAKAVLEKAGIKSSKDANKALDDYTDSVKDADAATKDLEHSIKWAKKDIKEWGKGILNGSGSIGDSMSGLGSILKTNSNIVGSSLANFAAGAGFALGAMENFAKSAADMGGFADLGAFKVGSVRQAKLLSGLGDNFIKVISESNGGFRAFGNSSQEATDNLSNLARGLRLGASASSGFGMFMSKDMRNNMNKASKATAAMGLSQEEQATLMGSIAGNVALGAKNEKQAQEMLVKQYADTVASARTLSNTFGVSAKEILKSVENFNKSTSGKAAALQGVQGAADIKQALQAAGVQGNEEDLNRMALALAKGERGAAATYTNPESQANLAAVADAVDAARQRQGGLGKAENLAAGMQAQRGTFEQIGAQRQNLGAKGQEGLFDTGVAAATLAKKMDLSAKAAAGDKKAQDEYNKLYKNSEANNIQTMDQLQGSLDWLRASVIGLTASVLGLTGMLAPLVMGGLFAGGGKLMDKITGGGSGGLLGGLTDKIFGNKTAGPTAGSLSGWKSGPTASTQTGGATGGATGGVGDKLGGIGKGVGDLLEGLGKGIGGAASAVLQGLATGLSAFKPQALLGAAILAGSIAIIGAGIAGATWLIGKALPTFAEGLKAFDDINGDNLVTIGAGLAAMGAGAVVFAAGMAIATTGSIITGILGLFGAKSPLERVMEFVPYADAISKLGQGMLNFGNGIVALNTGLAGLDTDKLNALKENMADISQMSINSPNITTDFSALNNASGNNIQSSALTPESLSQIMSYLSNIQNELQGIRGNTKSGPAVAPVRLS